MPIVSVAFSPSGTSGSAPSSILGSSGCSLFSVSSVFGVSEGSSTAGSDGCSGSCCALHPARQASSITSANMNASTFFIIFLFLPLNVRGFAPCVYHSPAFLFCSICSSRPHFPTFFIILSEHSMHFLRIFHNERQAFLSHSHILLSIPESCGGILRHFPALTASPRRPRCFPRR